jgi:protein-L-isoaspartate(D-aspartate) O-methyltransferase
MVDEQLKRRGIDSQAVLEAFLRVPRHAFVPAAMVQSSYGDHPLSIGQGQTISQPYIVALMTQLLELTGNETVLEIGTGSGYQTAILSLLCRTVYSIERHEQLHYRAAEVLAKQGYTNTVLTMDDGTCGWPEHSPFDRILVTAASSKIPEPLIQQLNDPGRLVIPLGPAFGQILTVLKKEKGAVATRQDCSCVFVPLIGKYAYVCADS